MHFRSDIDIMSKLEDFIENFYSYAITSTKSPNGSMLNLSTSVITSTGVDLAKDNHILFGPTANSVHIDCAIALMPSFRVSYSVPVLPGCDDFLPLLLADHGCVQEKPLHVMWHDVVTTEERLNSLEKVTKKNFADFMHTVYDCFKPSDNMAERYTEHMMFMTNIPIATAYMTRNKEEIPVASAIVFDSGKVNVIYNIAINPNEHSCAYSTALLNNICNQSFASNKPVALFASEPHVDFFTNNGYEDLAVIPIFTHKAETID